MKFAPVSTSQRHQPGRRTTTAVLVAAAFTVLVVGCSATTSTSDSAALTHQAPTTAPTPAPPPSPTPLGPALDARIPAVDAATETAPWYPFARVGEQYSAAVPGVLTFRGSPSRSFLGQGPVPANPQVKWSYPDRPMCSLSSDQHGTREWCGTGWTGQPAVWERGGETWVAFGAYDRQVHVLDGLTGQTRNQPFLTGDIIKGSLTVDPDGHPLLYVGSRDAYLRVLSFDQSELVELWRLDARSIEPRKWNDDWDSSPVILKDHLFVGGENSNFHIVELNRSYGPDRLVTVAPELVAAVPGWDEELLAQVGSNVSIEASLTVVDDIAYFANSGGLIQGWDLSGVASGVEPERVFRFWMGDDTDASVVVDDQGYLYAAAEYERGTPRSRDLGQIVKLDPYQPESPVIWSVDARSGIDTGVWATPAVYGELVVVPTADGRVLGLDRADGEVRFTLNLPGPLWSSPVIVDDVLIQGDCLGYLSAFDLTGLTGPAGPDIATHQPPKLWSVPVGGCIESTPVIWGGRIWVGTRAGYFHLIAD